MKIDYTFLNGLTNTVSLSNDASIISNGHFQLFNSLNNIDRAFSTSNINYITDITIYEVPAHVNNFYGCCLSDGWWEGMSNLCNFTLKDARIDNLARLVKGCTKIGRVDISNSIINPNANAWCAFYECENLYDFGQSNKDIFSNVGILGSAFSSCMNLPSEITLNLKSAFDIGSLFEYTNLSKIVIDDLPEDISIFRLCQECHNLKEITFNNCNIQHLYASDAFENCYLLENFSGMSSINNMSGQGIFRTCATIKSLPPITMTTGYLMGAFKNCIQLRDLDINFIDIDNESNYFWMADMFNNCSNLSNNSLVNIAQNLPFINTVKLDWPDV